MLCPTVTKLTLLTYCILMNQPANGGGQTTKGGAITAIAILGHTCEKVLGSLKLPLVAIYYIINCQKIIMSTKKMDKSTNERLQSG